MTRPPRNIVASVQARLVQRSHELHVEHQLTLARFTGERLLYRLAGLAGLPALESSWVHVLAAPEQRPEECGLRRSGRMLAE